MNSQEDIKTSIAKKEMTQVFKEYNEEEKLDSPTLHKHEDYVSLQFCGLEIMLLHDGTYFLYDTSGG